MGAKAFACKGGIPARARKLADWFVVNQVTNTLSADCGRFINEVHVKGVDRPPVYSSNWTTGMTVISLLMSYERFKDKRYLESAERAGNYLKSLQVLDNRNPAAYGFFKEVTPQNTHCHPRDALSAAWGLLHLFRMRGDAEAFGRVKIFAEWFRRYAMKDGYPAWTVYLENDKKPYWQKGSFHGGSPLFFFELYEMTREPRWKSIGLTICDTWTKTFLKEEGSIRVEVDAETGKDRTGFGPDPGHLGWQAMHKTNDDFTSLALLRAYRLTRKAGYLETARRYLDWVLTTQKKDGAFGDVPVHSAAATLVLELMDLFLVSKEKKYREALQRSIPHFLSLQELTDPRPLVHGGFYCTSGDYANGIRRELGVRTSSYALAALLRLEGKRAYQGYTA
ncbi:MAG: hypothetical protein V1913_05550 [Fibrobacterota bacterium]